MWKAKKLNVKSDLILGGRKINDKMPFYVAKKFFNLFLILFSASLFSQQTGGNNNQQFQNMVFNVSGLVSDSDTDEPLEYATISLKNKRTPDKVFGGITGTDGKFSVEVPPGIYEIIIDYISFESYSNSNLIVRGNTDLGKIIY